MKQREASDPTNLDKLRDLSVNHEKTGNVRVSQGDQAGALKSYGAVLEIREKLTASDPSNAEWQRDLITVYVRLVISSADRVSYLKKALTIASKLKDEGWMAPVDEWMIDDLQERLEAAKSGG